MLCITASTSIFAIVRRIGSHFFSVFLIVVIFVHDCVVWMLDAVFGSGSLVLSAYHILLERWIVVTIVMTTVIHSMPENRGLHIFHCMW